MAPALTQRGGAPVTGDLHLSEGVEVPDDIDRLRGCDFVLNKCVISVEQLNAAAPGSQPTLVCLIEVGDGVESVAIRAGRGERRLRVEVFVLAVDRKRIVAFRTFAVSR